MTLMRPLFLLLAGMFSLLSGTAQYKDDNVRYKTVYPADLCKELEKHNGYLLLDVRSPGEYADTSSSLSLNLGHLRGARNIDIQQIAGRLNEIAGYKDKPVFVYCSHSQRSRRVSNMLVDSGFTKVFNVNGGITAIHLLPDNDPCQEKLVESTNAYAVISPATLCQKLGNNGKNIILLDVRPDSAWNHQLSQARYNAYGQLQGARHIATADLDEKVSELPRDKEIILVDLNGYESSRAAQILLAKGFKKVSVLMEGLDRWMTVDKSSLSCAKSIYEPAVSYTIMGPADFFHFYPMAKNVLLLDVRSVEEFNNRHAQTYRNMGHLKDARNIPAADLVNQLALISDHKNEPVVIYEFANGNDTYRAANLLVKNGFTQVYVLAGGIFNIRWTASNVPGMMEMHQWVVDVPDEYR
jgi:rhodanese-related sulfurtransferase